MWSGRTAFPKLISFSGGLWIELPESGGQKLELRVNDLGEDAIVARFVKSGLTT